MSRRARTRYYIYSGGGRGLLWKGDSALVFLLLCVAEQLGELAAWPYTGRLDGIVTYRRRLEWRRAECLPTLPAP